MRSEKNLQIRIPHPTFRNQTLPPARLERATYGLEGRRSIQLSYGSIQRASKDVSDCPMPSQILRGVGPFFVDPRKHLLKDLREVEFAGVDHDGIVGNCQRGIFACDVAFVAFVDLGERLFIG